MAVRRKHAVLKLLLIHWDAKLTVFLPARKYNVQVKGCLPDSAGCGSFKEKAMWTKPNRMFCPKIFDATLIVPK